MQVTCHSTKGSTVASVRGSSSGGAAKVALIAVVASARFLVADTSEFGGSPGYGWQYNTGGRAARGANANQELTDDADPWYPDGAGANSIQRDPWATPENPAGGSQQYRQQEDVGMYAPQEPWAGPREEDQGDGKGEGRQATRNGRRRATKRTRKRGQGGGGGGDGTGDMTEFDENGEPLRSDLVQEYMRSFKGRMLLSGSASVVGAALGAMISKSTIQRTPLMSLVGFFLGLVLSVAKGAFGDLFRALGLALALSLRRSRRLSAEYPFLPYARRALVMAPRRPFPPAENPWKYKREEALRDAQELGVGEGMLLPAEFSMAKSLLSIAFLGGFAGYMLSQVVFLPTFLLALGCSGFLAYMATTRNARGDLTRLVGMRTVAFLGLLSETNSDVGLAQKAKIVGGICLNKAMFWDSKYHIKDRVVVVLSNLYAALAKLVRRVQRDAGGVEDRFDDDDMDFNNARFSERNEAFSEGGAQGKHGQRRRTRAGDDVPPPPPPPGPPPDFASERGGSYQGGGARRDYSWSIDTGRQEGPLDGE